MKRRYGTSAIVSYWRWSLLGKGRYTDLLGRSENLSFGTISGVVTYDGKLACSTSMPPCCTSRP